MSPFDVFVAERHSCRRPSWMKNVVSPDATLLVWLIWLSGLEGSMSNSSEFRSFTVYVEGGLWDTSTEKVLWSQNYKHLEYSILFAIDFFLDLLLKFHFWNWYFFSNKFAINIPLHCQYDKWLFIKMSSHHIWIFLYIINTFFFISAI